MVYKTVTGHLTQTHGNVIVHLTYLLETDLFQTSHKITTVNKYYYREKT